MSQEDCILSALLAGETITPMDALTRWGCFRLGARIYEPKRQGYRIVKETIRNGRKTYAAYRLEPVQLEIAA